LQALIEKHLLYTKSHVAEKILVNWEEYMSKFVKVLPLEYKKVINEIKLRELNSKIKKAEYDFLDY